MSTPSEFTPLTIFADATRLNSPLLFPEWLKLLFDKGLDPQATITRGGTTQSLIERILAWSKDTSQIRTPENFQAAILPLIEEIRKTGPLHWETSEAIIDSRCTPVVLKRLFDEGMPTRGAYLTLKSNFRPDLADVIHQQKPASERDEWQEMVLLNPHNRETMLAWARQHQVPVLLTQEGAINPKMMHQLTQTKEGLALLESQLPPDMAVDHSFMVQLIGRGQVNKEERLETWDRLKVRLTEGNDVEKSNLLFRALDSEYPLSLAQELWTKGYRPSFSVGDTQGESKEVSLDRWMKVIEWHSSRNEHLFLAGQTPPSTRNPLLQDMQQWIESHTPRELMVQHWLDLSTNPNKQGMLATENLTQLLAESDAQSTEGQEPLLWRVAQTKAIQWEQRDHSYSRPGRHPDPRAENPAEVALAQRILVLSQQPGAVKDSQGHSLVEALIAKKYTVILKRMGIPLPASAPDAVPRDREAFMALAGEAFDQAQAMAMSSDSPRRLGMGNFGSPHLELHRSMHVLAHVLHDVMTGRDPPWDKILGKNSSWEKAPLWTNETKLEISDITGDTLSEPTRRRAHRRP